MLANLWKRLFSSPPGRPIARVESKFSGLETMAATALASTVEISDRKSNQDAENRPAFAIVVPRDNRKLSPNEYALAKRICEDAKQLVLQRESYIETHGIDPAFALPDANWSYDAPVERPNEFAQLFRRVAGADIQVFENFRGFCHVFTGFSVFKAGPGFGLASANMELAASLNDDIAESIRSKNLQFVEAWLAMIQDIPFSYLVNPPLFLGECGHLVNGVVVNFDTMTYQERANLIYQTGLSRWIEKVIERRGEIRVCEIGGGYGALALWFKRVFPNCSYTIIDLPECLLFSRLYLSLTRPDVRAGAGLEPQPFGFRFVPNYMAEKIDEPFDLIINTLSMSEMNLVQVENYVDMMKRVWLKDGGVFFEQNADVRYMNLLCAQDILAKHFPERKQVVLDRGKFVNGSPNIWSLHPIDLT